MKVLICGGRNYNDYETLEKILDSYPISTIICGGASGADTMAEFYGRMKDNVKVEVYQADWEKYGKSAGPRRNRKMLDDNPDVELVIAFPGGRGTHNMIDYAASKNIKVIKI